MKQYALILVVFLTILMVGCSNQVLLRMDRLQEKQTVEITLNTGERVSGEIAKIDEKTITIVDAQNRAWRAKKSDIHRIVGPRPALDLSGHVISEREIAKRMQKKNRLLYALSGGALSLGASFFVSSLISRGVDGNAQDAVIYGGTAGGTVLGGFLFYRLGAQKDCQEAINELRIRGGDTLEDLQKQRERRKRIQKELEEARKERERQQREIEELKKKIKEKK